MVKPPENRISAADRDTDWRKKNRRASVEAVATDNSGGEEEVEVEVEIPKKDRRARFRGEDSDVEDPPMRYEQRKEPYSESPKREKPKKDLLPRTGERAYKLVTKFDDENTIRKLVDRTEKTMVNDISVGDLVSMSPGYAKELRKSMGRIRQPIKPILLNGILDQESAFPFMEDDIQVRLQEDAIDLNDLPMVDSFYISTEEDLGTIPGSYVAIDPYLQYMSSLDDKEAPKQVYSGTSSASLRVVHPLVATRQHVESVVDSGSQIVSMALTVAEELGIPWDPDAQIYMQSANGQLKKSAGLARNVCFLFGDIPIYLQVHIIDQPAYKVLLGRPFDILTESRIDNKGDGTQTLTIKDPNGTRRCVIPTQARGAFSATTNVKKIQEEVKEQKAQKIAREQLMKSEREADFHNSPRNWSETGEASRSD